MVHISWILGLWNQSLILLVSSESWLLNDSKLQCLALVVPKTVNFRPVTYLKEGIFSLRPLGGENWTCWHHCEWCYRRNQVKLKFHIWEKVRNLFLWSGILTVIYCNDIYLKKTHLWWKCISKEIDIFIGQIYIFISLKDNN